MDMTNDRFTGLLSDYLDDELEPRERASLDAHLGECAECRRVLADLRLIVARAATLETPAPERDLWPGVASRLGAPGAGLAAVHSIREAARRRFSFTLPQIAAASLALMILSGSMVWMARSGNERADFPVATASDSMPGDIAVPVRFAEVEYEEAIADLEQILEAGRSTLDRKTVTVLEENLKTIDAAIEQARRALAADPANGYLNSHLAKARQRKLALLRRATGLTSVGS